MSEAARKIRVQCVVNGRAATFETYPMARLLDVLREQAGLTGDARLHAVQQAFLLHGGAQCGICTPGMILAAVNLLARNPRPSEIEIREGLSGNLCRCTGYTKIFASVVEACRDAEKRA